MDGKIIIQTVMFSTAVLFITSRLAAGKTLLEPSPVSMPVAALTILIVLAAFFAQNRPLALESCLLFLAYISCFYIFLSMLKQQNQQVSLVYIILAVALVLCISGLYKFYLLNLNPFLTSVWRLRATFGNSNQMAGFLSMIIPVHLGLMLTEKFSILKFSILSLIMLILVITLFFTYARGGWISTFIATGFVFFCHMPGKRKQTKKIFTISILFFLTLSLVFLSSTNLVNRFNTMTQQDAEATIYGRFLAWEGTIEMIKANPVTGVGPGNYSKAFRQFQPPGLMDPYIFAHSDYLEFISETGLLLIPIMLWLVYSLFARGFKKIKNAGQQVRGITLGAMGGILAMLIYSISDFTLQIPANALLFTVLAAIVMGSGLPHILSDTKRRSE